MRQVIISICVICKGGAIGCYDSERTPAKLDCIKPDGTKCSVKCPNPTHPFSHGFCNQHFEEKMRELIEKQKERRNETNLCKSRCD